MIYNIYVHIIIEVIHCRESKTISTSNSASGFQIFIRTSNRNHHSTFLEKLPTQHIGLTYYFYFSNLPKIYLYNAPERECLILDLKLFQGSGWLCECIKSYLKTGTGSTNFYRPFWALNIKKPVLRSDFLF